MKKILVLLLAIVMVFSLAACQSSTGGDTEGEQGGNETTPAISELTLEEAMEDLLEGLDEINVSNIPLTEENFESFAFIPYNENLEGLASEAMISSIAHSVVLVRVKDGDVEAIAKEISENANPVKWVCVSAEKTKVVTKGDTIMLVMSNTGMANKILTNFYELNGDTVPDEDVYTPDMDNTGNDALAPDTGGDLLVTDPVVDPVVDPEVPTVDPNTEDDDKDGSDEPPIAPPNPTPEVEPEPTPDPTPETNPDPAPDAGGTDLSALMATLLNGVDLPAVGDVPLSSENFSFYAFTEYKDGFNGLASDAMMSSVAHSVVLVEVPEGEDVAAIASGMESNADPRKWICVAAEKVEVATKGNLILLVMSSEATVDQIIANFNA